MQLDRAAEAAGARLITHDTIDSTNAEGLRLARAGERGPLWIAARSQTAGRGRRGRHRRAHGVRLLEAAGHGGLSVVDHRQQRR